MDAELLRRTSGGDYLFGCVWAFVLGVAIFLWPLSREDRSGVLVLWGAKIVVTLGAMLAYEQRYILDAYFYFASGQFSPPAFGDVSFGDGTQVMEFLSGLHSSVLPISYHAEKVSCAYIGLVAIYQFYGAARVRWPTLGVRPLYVVGLFPSILFWSSILGKDPLVLLGIGLFVRGIVGWYVNDNLLSLCLSVAGVLVAAAIRPWLAPILVAPLLIFVLMRVQSLWTRLIFIGFLGVGAAASAQFFLAHIQAESATDVIDYSNTVAHSWQAGGSGQQLDVQINTPAAFIGFLPLGMFTALFRPLPGEIFTPFAFLASLENGVLLFLAYRAARRFRRSDLRDGVVVWMLSFILCWSAAYGFACYQNLGTSVRFRLQVMPIFIGLLLYFQRPLGSEWETSRLSPVDEEGEFEGADVDVADDLDENSSRGVCSPTLRPPSDLSSSGA